MTRIFVLSLALAACGGSSTDGTANGAIPRIAFVDAGGARSWDDEVFYHVWVRSFFDSNGDRHGDLRGIRSKLDYIQSLGVTALWLSPIVASPNYHNYRASGFFSGAPELGTIEDLRELDIEVHRRGMKILIDMETQYIAEDHPWWIAAKANPSAPEQQFILCRPPHEDLCWTDADVSYDGTIRTIVRLDMLTPQMLEYQKRIFSFWLDPNRDGDLTDGVDGYRLDRVPRPPMMSARRGRTRRA